MLVRLIAPNWLTNKKSLPSVLEGDFSDEKIRQYNIKGYNVYYFPNCPKEYSKEEGKHLDGSQIDDFKWVFVDYDCKTNTYSSKEAFIDKVKEIPPTKIIDSGHGIHAYWRISDLDAKAYLRLSRRLMRHFNTDEAVGKILQLMRLEGTANTKHEGQPVLCSKVLDSDKVYTCEDLNKLLPALRIEDEEYCTHHFDSTLNKEHADLKISEKMPAKWGKFLLTNDEAKKCFAGNTNDRSKADWRLAHLLFGNGFQKDEAATVLMHSAKALERAPHHRLTYVYSLISKIWTYETSPNDMLLSESVEDILKKSGDNLSGVEFRCHPRIDNTEEGFRLGHVIGLVAGSGVGKTSFAMNMFKWFCERNPEYTHFFVPLEQPAREIAKRWREMCGKNISLHAKVHVISNYDDKGQFRHLSLHEIKDYIINWQIKNNKKAGCVVIDHIGALKKQTKEGENQGLMDLCHSMKGFAIETNTLVVMQSQSSREKAGIGDIELDKDAAYGTVYFESYCDYLITIWQPLKRCHGEEQCPLVTAFKFCKIRHKNSKKDLIKEDSIYYFSFDPETESYMDMTQDQEISFKFFIGVSTSKRRSDKKVDIQEYKSVPYTKEDDGTVPTNSNRQTH